MIGQVKLQQELLKYDLNNLPHTLLLLGPSGCGKHTIINLLMNKLSMTYIDITNELNLEFIENTYLNNFKTIYLIDMNQLTDRQQNMILKLIEEPNENTYLILICNNKEYLLSTIINRCVTYVFEQYTKEELLNFDNNELILNICETPGQILSLNKNILNDMIIICDKIIHNINQASISNTLTLLDKFNYKDNYDKFDIILSLKLMLYNIMLDVINNNMQSIKMYNIIKNTLNKCLNNRYNKENILTDMLIDLWRIAHES